MSCVFGVARFVFGCNRSNKRIAAPPRRPVVERMETRLHFDVMVNSQAYDSASVAENYNQNETAVVAMSAPGSTSTQLATAFNDDAMFQFGGTVADGSPAHGVSSAYS